MIDKKTNFEFRARATLAVKRNVEQSEKSNKF